MPVDDQRLGLTRPRSQAGRTPQPTLPSNRALGFCTPHSASRLPSRRAHRHLRTRRVALIVMAEHPHRSGHASARDFLLSFHSGTSRPPPVPNWNRSEQLRARRCANRAPEGRVPAILADSLQWRYTASCSDVIAQRTTCRCKSQQVPLPRMTGRPRRYPVAKRVTLDQSLPRSARTAARIAVMQ